MLFVALLLQAEPAPPDLVIRNGRIVDGTGNPWFLGDVAVAGGRISYVGPKSPRQGAREIDARGLAVAPGFIDMHSHSDFTILEDGLAESKIRQGVTTELLGEGDSAAPRQGKLVGGRFRTLADYFGVLESAGISINVASYVGEGTVWRCVMGESFDRPSGGDLERMKELVAQAMADGAFGLSSMLMMPPGSLATTDDLVTLCGAVRPRGGLFSSHIHDEGLGVLDSIRQVIEVAERAGVPLDVIHLKIADQKLWGRMKDAVGLIEAARQRGVNVQANVYPYTRGSNDLASIIPPWAHEGGVRRMLQRLGDPADRARIKKDIESGLPGWYNHYTAVGRDWSRMLVAAEGPYRGMTMDRMIAQKKGDPLDILLDLLLERGGSVPTVYAHHSEEDMNLALAQSWCSVGSDGLALAAQGPLRRGNPHPRSFGTFPRVLGVYVRERGLLRLEDAVRKMTSLSASKLGMADRGLVKAGMAADLAIFNPQTVADRATYDDPFQYPVGIEYVVVNGVLVMDRGTHTGAKPGRALRHAR